MLGKDFKEFVASLNAHEVEYLVIGGYAVAYHGFPRYTRDLDLWIGRAPENIAGLLKALEDFGFSSLGLTAVDFQNPDTVVQLGHPPHRIDLLCGVGGLDFAEAYARRENIVLDGIPVAFIHRQDLVTTKRAAGRHQDLADVENLTAPDEENPE
ncbi:MAG: hypothetical protein KJ726_10255 [Verrucomicrobia bacterium]|nr:hypothetical protein [Verrucomicrobiota bacterium]